MGVQTALGEWASVKRRPSDASWSRWGVGILDSGFWQAMWPKPISSARMMMMFGRSVAYEWIVRNSATTPTRCIPITRKGRGWHIAISVRVGLWCLEQPNRWARILQCHHGNSFIVSFIHICHTIFSAIFSICLILFSKTTIS